MARRLLPKARLEASTHRPRRISVEELTDIFLWEEERKADKTGCIKVLGNIYEVDLELAKEKVFLRYDPFDLTTGIQVWNKNKRYQDAKPIELTRKYHPPEEQATKAIEGLSFFKVAEEKRQKELAKDPLTFTRKEGKAHA